MSLKTVVLPHHEMHCSYLQVSSVFLKGMLCTIITSCCLSPVLTRKSITERETTSIAPPLQLHCSAQGRCTAVREATGQPGSSVGSSTSERSLGEWESSLGSVCCLVRGKKTAFSISHQNKGIVGLGRVLPCTF